MKSTSRFVVLAMMEVVLCAALVACGGGANSGAETIAAPAPPPASDLQAIQLAKFPVIVTPTVGGSVTGTSTLYNFNCSSSSTNGCTSSVTKYNSVYLTATPAAGYTFAGWGDACAGTARCITMITAATNITATFTATGGTTATGTPSGLPIVSYTDTINGPTSGGENNHGGYLSIFGSNFGSASDLGTVTKVFIGDVEVANYRYLGQSKVGTRLGLQQLTVQVGALGGATVGKALPIKVVVNGVASNTSETFTPSAGRVLFVSLAGNDATAVPGDITHPFRSLQNMSTLKGAYFSMATGDQVVIRGGKWSDTNGVDTSWMKFGAGIYARNGTPTAYIHFTAYPGPILGNAIEDVHYTTPAGTSGGFQGPWSAIAGSSGEYISISNMHFQISGGANRDAAPINFQYTGGHWRVVNNEIGPWVAGSSTTLNAAGVSGHGDGNVVLGNHIHDIAGLTDLQNHGIYADTTAQNWDVAYNYIHDITGGSLIQFNDNEAGAGTYKLPHGGKWAGFVNMQVHHNWLERAAKYGINFNDQGSAKAGTYSGKIWNNVIIGTALPPLRINSTQPTQALWFAYNTVYNCMTTFSGSGNGYVRMEGWAAQSGVNNTFFNNIFMIGPNTTSGTQWFANVGGTAATTKTFNFKRNLYYGNSQTPSAPSTIGDNMAVVGNPMFNNATTSDFTTQTGSPARLAATQALQTGFVVTDDFSRLMTRVVGAPSDIGAYVSH